MYVGSPEAYRESFNAGARQWTIAGFNRIELLAGCWPLHARSPSLLYCCCYAGKVQHKRREIVKPPIDILLNLIRNSYLNVFFYFFKQILHT